MSLAPQLQRITVDVDKLLLDPNNPRLFSREESRVPLENVKDPGVQEKTQKRLFPVRGKDRFNIEELKQSIKMNGYTPEAGGYIFVRQIEGTDYFLVLEGNRRLVALRELREDHDHDDAIEPDSPSKIQSIDVLEITDDLPEDQLQEKISYLLGTCHHGSHKNWSPFARAEGIYNRYLQISNQTHNSFVYQKTPHGETVASLLSIEEKEVKERLEVYTTMRQLSEEPSIQSKKNGGIIDRYYSLILGAIKTSSKGLQAYISREPKSLQLRPEAIERMINLCNFDGTRDRKTARQPGGTDHPPAIINPQQWKFLGKILDDDPSEKDANLSSVEIDHQPPEEVWARRHAALTKLTWPKWLEKVVGILTPVNLGALNNIDPEATDCINRLNTLYDVIRVKMTVDDVIDRPESDT